VGKTVPKALAVYKTRPFARFARKARIPDVDLWKAARLANDGLIDADLGGGVIKQRIARRGEGKSGGSRSIILYKKDNRAIYVHGFEKKDVSNIGSKDLDAFRKLAGVYLGYTGVELAQRVADGTLLKVEEPEGEDNA
jgi:hypothetical protein